MMAMAFITTLSLSLFVPTQSLVDLNCVQRTGHTERLRVQIAHGRFQRLMAHGLLDRPRIGATIEAMRCIGMTQFMRQDE